MRRAFTAAQMRPGKPGFIPRRTVDSSCAGITGCLRLSLSTFPLGELERHVRAPRGALWLEPFRQRAERRRFFSTQAGVELRDVRGARCSWYQKQIFSRSVRACSCPSWRLRCRVSSALCSLSLCKLSQLHSLVFAPVQFLPRACLGPKWFVIVSPLCSFGPKYKGETPISHSWFYFSLTFLNHCHLSLCNFFLRFSISLFLYLLF